ncbi:hypothetical protein EDB85DRAFT_1300926 [Lactarius pseudohatsudake]|nr:hypothetical protein EDB85DRAFT_1300926 [Lactarius pseudohatsudake]
MTNSRRAAPWRRVQPDRTWARIRAVVVYGDITIILVSISHTVRLETEQRPRLSGYVPWPSPHFPRRRGLTSGDRADGSPTLKANGRWGPVRCLHQESSFGRPPMRTMCTDPRVCDFVASDNPRFARRPQRQVKKGRSNRKHSCSCSFYTTWFRKSREYNECVCASNLKVNVLLVVGDRGGGRRKCVRIWTRITRHR